MKSHYKTLVISDVHLGTQGSKAKELVRFLKQVKCDNLILNGDIIDAWQLKRSGIWKKKHTRFFKRIVKMMEEDGTQVTYLRGNHDDFLDNVLPLQIGNLSIQRDMVYESAGKRYYIVHGDIFDSITTNLRWIAKLGDIGYTFLLWLNRQYNAYRLKKGLPYYSLSQVVKAKVKSAVSYIDDFETQLAEIAINKECDGIICGHIHQPALKEIHGILYLNSGDWVESMSALAESHAGEWSLVYFSQTERSTSGKMHKVEEEEEEDSSLDVKQYLAHHLLQNLQPKTGQL
ncbi:UDP-2,3-diacylglucosamine diphosphatase [Cytophagales bacterium LB-30]|uniref:UDP-2,3-diacylglucosamine diphosphatase n=1 Tax=Shiella aurantiaca TaxID=3058365 RepID=A0ABT8F2Y3_9BACT|nr:UDP-2,3-diacylglucosamine diphosphatase [Shiella aurantiaca]MDN4164815.1 UDP-2,3-diacylglucosamine diphosphatase [Shiella aurantiaca]